MSALRELDWLFSSAGDGRAWWLTAHILRPAAARTEQHDEDVLSRLDRGRARAVQKSPRDQGRFPGRHRDQVWTNPQDLRQGGYRIRRDSLEAQF